MDKVARDNLIVKMRADGKTMPSIAKQLGLQRRGSNSSYKTMLTASSRLRRQKR
jgi:hypothetical protein